MTRKEEWRKLVKNIINEGRNASAARNATEWPEDQRVGLNPAGDGQEAGYTAPAGYEQVRTSGGGDQTAVSRIRQRSAESVDGQSAGAGPSRTAGHVVMSPTAEDDEATPSSPPPAKRQRRKAARDPTAPCGRCGYALSHKHGAYTSNEGVVVVACGACRSYFTKNGVERPKNLWGTNRNAKDESRQK